MNMPSRFPRLLPTLWLALIAICLGAANASAGDYKSPLAKLDLKEGDSIVFLGDSITHQCLYTQYVEDYYFTRHPKLRLKFHNAGVGGAKAWDALARLDRDVKSYGPKYVTILLGMNDGSYQPFNQEIFDTYHRDMTELVARIQESGATPILMTPTMFDSRAARIRATERPRPTPQLEQYNSVLAYYGTWLREVAAESGYGFVDMWSPLNNLTIEQRKQNPDFTLIKDAVHPDEPGQLVMAYALLNDLGAQKPLSNIRITIGGKGNAKAKASGGEVTELKATDDGLEFTWQAEGLPWVVPAAAQPGAELLKLGHRFSREALDVQGLAAGKYELSIDGTVVGTYPAVAFTRHIELQSNDKTPQHQQALKVAELNQSRNDGPIKMLRGEWVQFQQHARMAKQLAGAPDNADLKTKVDELAQKLVGMEERIVQHEASAKQIEDEIFASNQPPARKYVLKRVN